MTEVIFLLDAHNLARHEATSSISLRSSSRPTFPLNNPSPLKKGNGGISGSLFFCQVSALDHLTWAQLALPCHGQPDVLGKGCGSLPAWVIPYRLRAILLPAKVVNAL